MKKRVIVLIMIFVIMTSSVTTYASVSDKLANHWANSLVDRTFIAYYFPYLAKDNFARFEPNGFISNQDFTLSLASLFKDYNYTISAIGVPGNLTRNNMVDLLGAKLSEVDIKYDNNLEIPFKDTNTMSNASIELLRLLFSHGIIVGESNSTFNPDRMLTQVEAIIVLQRVKGVLEEMNSIAFKTLGIVQSFNNQEEIIIKEDNGKVLVTITKAFPTPGYSMTTSKIMRERDGYKVFFNITPPKPDSIQLQVITYKTMTIEIDKNIIGDPPYNFILEGFNAVLTNTNT